MIGKRFGNLTVVSAASTDKTKWLCVCDCGSSKIIHNDTLQSADTLICGVKCPLYRKLYKVWEVMRLRCTSRKNRDYHKVGARGIKYHPDWFYFDNFVAWAKASGYEEGLHLVRKDMNKNYTPENCKWVTKSEMFSMVHKGLTYKPRVKGRKLTVDDVKFIRRWPNDSDVEMAARFHVCINTIKNVRNYKTWRHI